MALRTQKNYTTLKILTSFFYLSSRQTRDVRRLPFNREETKQKSITLQKALRSKSDQKSIILPRGHGKEKSGEPGNAMQTPKDKDGSACPRAH